jgi:hypothetical protein
VPQRIGVKKKNRWFIAVASVFIFRVLKNNFIEEQLIVNGVLVFILCFGSPIENQSKMFIT